jgi:hypothetical protein
MTTKNATTPAEELLLPALKRITGTPVLAESSYSIESAQTKDGQQMQGAAGKHELAMRLYAHKTAYAVDKASELVAHGTRTFVKTCEAIDAAADAAKGTPSQPYAEVFVKYQKDQLADQIATLSIAGLGMVRREVTTPLPDKAPPDPPRPGRLRRIFGG